MIIVDVRAPALEKVYNLSLDENALVMDLIEEITELIAQKEGVLFSGTFGEVVLAVPEQEIQCDKNLRLRDYGIRSGDELILV